MEAELAVGGGDGTDGMFIKENIATALDEEAEAVKGFDVPFEFFPRHHHNGNPDPLFAGLIEILILNVKWGLGHVRSF
jgi:hypothetical protein